MNRRAFLRLTVRGRERILDLSCERLYMRWVDALAGDARPIIDDGIGLRAEWEGEPPLDVVVQTPDALFAELEEHLAHVQILRMTGRQWLAGGEFGREVESRIEAFRQRGGRVE
jgi:hypothetical protein